MAIKIVRMNHEKKNDIVVFETCKPIIALAYFISV